VDGCTDNTLDLLQELEFPITIVSYPKNKGKGHALKKGFRKAIELGFEYALTIDSDGQHYPEDIPLLIDAIKKHPGSMIIGSRKLTSENVPGKNKFANKFSNFWYKVETGHTLSDTQSGFRLYPLERLQNLHLITRRYEFEVEIIVRAAWRGVNVENVPIKVYYPPVEERISHFRPLRDFTRISILNTVLVACAILYYYPCKFFRSLIKRDK
jgi:glycosyltransferase involved in cell wall biosynthesis